MGRTIAAFLLAVLYGTHLIGAVISPIGLAPGSQYQLIFATADLHNAVSTDIATYNAFVTSEAALGVPFGLPSGVTWTAVASTSTVNANVNAPSGTLPVYNTDGQEVAAAGVGIYTGTLENVVGFDQYGATATAAQANNVWTGSDFQGAGLHHATLGGGGNGEVGQLAIDSTWLQFALEPQAAEVTFSRPFYALSTAITVPTPEPSTLTLLGLALLAIGGHRGLRWLRQR
jgi:PEP-CTERM motif-containing protein